ncbi:hypothetical protein LSH36_237g04011 [Paralvinella palmiformis]|uniref:Myb/SANT-like DNA-binding domain-containing protein n=1 Tax=Paralvinella palmiformis TaxID=53620 RepID=A0AAD9JP37_9ANNE|nr:hypothetical protein LSH36_237g04011 [Paralvinella palmiformis]
MRTNIGPSRFRDSVNAGNTIYFAVLFSAVLNSKNSPVTEKDKQMSWASVTNSVTGVGHTSRSQKQVIDKWLDLKSRSTHKLAFHKREIMKTGGGNKPAPLDEEDEQVAGILGE